MKSIKHITKKTKINYYNSNNPNKYMKKMELKLI